MSHPCIDCDKNLPHKETLRCKDCYDKFKNDYPKRKTNGKKNNNAGGGGR